MKLSKKRILLLLDWADELKEIYINSKVISNKIPTEKQAEKELSKLCFDYISSLSQIYNYSNAKIIAEHKIMEAQNNIYLDEILGEIEYNLKYKNNL